MNWKSTYGVSDEGASAAGVYGAPNSTWDVARAQQATRDLQADRSATHSAPATSHTPYSTANYGTSTYGATAYGTGSSIGTGHYPSYSPPSALGRAIGWVAGLIGRVIAYSALLVLGLTVLAIVVFTLTGFVTLPDTSGVNTAALRDAPIDGAYYATESPMVLELAGIPASTLYNTHLKDTPPDWNRLNGRHRAAIEAAWLRYLQDPQAFRRLQQFPYFRQVFYGYLLHRGQATRDPVPLLDRGRFASTASPLAGLEYWATGSIALPDDPALAALAMDAGFWDRFGYCLVRGGLWWLERFSDTDARLDLAR